MMSRSGTIHPDLIRRLRACETEYVEGQPAGVGAPFNPDGPEAADALEAADDALTYVRSIADRCVDADHYTAADALNDLQNIRSCLIRLAPNTQSPLPPDTQSPLPADTQSPLPPDTQSPWPKEVSDD